MVPPLWWGDDWLHLEWVSAAQFCLARRFASLWAHGTMWLHLEPLRGNTKLIQGLIIILECFTWIMVAWTSWWASRGGRPTPPRWVRLAHISPFCNVLHKNSLSTSGSNCYLIKICSCYAILPFYSEVVDDDFSMWIYDILTVNTSKQPNIGDISCVVHLPVWFAYLYSLVFHLWLLDLVSNCWLPC